MPRILLIDLFRVLLFPKDQSYFGDLDPLYISRSKLPDFKFSDHFQFNSQLLQYLANLSPQLELYLFTASTQFLAHPRAKEVLEPLFKSVYTTSDLGMRKTDTESFQLVCSKLQTIPPEVVYIGDNSSCVEAATRAGIKSLHFTSNSQIISDLSKLLSSQP